MYPAGHYGVALLFAVPVAYFLDRRPGVVVSMFVLAAAVLPDLDKHVPYVIHHGVTHTFLFAAVSGVAVGLLVAGLLLAYVRVTGPPRSRTLTVRRAFVWTAIGVFLGSSAHVIADVFVLLPGTQPISPFWPVFERKLHVETVPLGAPARNLGFLVAGLAAQTLIYHYKKDSRTVSPSS